jgi:uncharacterized protein YkwD
MTDQKKPNALAAFLGKQTPPPAPRAARPTKSTGAKTTASSASPPASEASKRTLGDGRQQLLVYLHPAGVRELKKAVHVEELGESVSAVVAEAVNEWLQKRGLQPLA